jgi:hypothetical protein
MLTFCDFPSADSSNAIRLDRPRRLLPPARLERSLLPRSSQPGPAAGSLSAWYVCSCAPLPFSQALTSALVSFLSQAIDLNDPTKSISATWLISNLVQFVQLSVCPSYLYRNHPVSDFACSFPSSSPYRISPTLSLPNPTTLRPG